MMADNRTEEERHDADPDATMGGPIGVAARAAKALVDAAAEEAVRPPEDALKPLDGTVVGALNDERERNREDADLRDYARVWMERKSDTDLTEREKEAVVALKKAQAWDLPSAAPHEPPD